MDFHCIQHFLILGHFQCVLFVISYISIALPNMLAVKRSTYYYYFIYDFFFFTVTESKYCFTQSYSGVCLTSSVTMIKGYRSSERKLNMHQILNASSSEMSRWFLLRFFLAHSVQHILLKSTRSKLSCTCSQRWKLRERATDSKTWIPITKNFKGDWNTQCCMLSLGTGSAFPGLPDKKEPSSA